MIVGDRYRGSLENEPMVLEDVRAGDQGHFGPAHVAAFYRHPQGYEIPPE